MNRAADFDIPARVWSNWSPTNGRRELRRALTQAERGLVASRQRELSEGLAPYQPAEAERVEIAIKAMFSGFRSMRQVDGAAEAIVVVLRAVLKPFPAWAIERACVKIARNEIPGLDPQWPPNDAQVHAVVTDIVKPYLVALDTANGLLEAPVEPKEEPKPRKTYEEIKADFAKHGFHLGGEKPMSGEDANVFLQKYGVSREAYDQIPDLPKDHEYWGGKRPPKAKG